MAVRSGEGPHWSVHPRQFLWKVSDTVRQWRQRRALAPSAARGRRGEDLAHRYLRSAGFSVIARNYRAGADSEIDIVARTGNITVFVEVKSRTSEDHGLPDRAIDHEKRKHILRAARSFVTRAGLDWTQVRFDTISIVLTNPPSIVHHEDVFFEGRAI